MAAVAIGRYGASIALCVKCACTAIGQEACLVDVTPCLEIESATARLECYDSLGRSVQERPSTCLPMTIREETDFVVSADGVRAPQNSPVEEIFSEVAAVRELAPGRVEVTLVNGQVWRQTHTDRYRLRVGHKVRIYPAGFGGVYFRLTAPTLRGFVQVERVR